MKSRKQIWIMVFPILMSLMLIACGGDGEPQASVPDPSPTLSSADHSRMGLEYYEQGEFDRAIDEFEISIALDPDNAESHRNLGTVYLEQGKMEEAVTSYEKSIELNPDYGEAHGDLAAAYFSLGRIPEAILSAGRGIELNPDYAMSYNNLAVAYGSQGDVDQAITLLEQAIRVDPDCDRAHYNLGYSYEILGQYDEAISEYQEAIRINPGYADANENLGKIYADLEGANAGSEYSNAESGYSVSYPAGWYYTEDGIKTGFTVTREHYDSQLLESLLVTIVVAPLDQVAQGCDLNQNAAPAEFLLIMAGRIEAEVEEIDSLQIVGYPAAIAATSGTVLDSPYRGNMIIIMVEERLFLAEAIAPPDLWDTSRPTFVDMINSLAFF